MKMFPTVLVLVSSASLASAKLIVYDGFDYSADGNPVLGVAATGAKGKGVWTSQGPTPQVNEVRVVAGSLAAPALPTPVGNSVQLNNGTGANASRLFLGNDTGGSPYSTGSRYYSFAVTIPSNPSGVTANGPYFAGFDNTAASTYLTAAGLWVKTDPTNTSRIDLGISNSGAAPKDAVYSSTSYVGGSTLLVVGSFTFSGTATLDVFTANDLVPIANAPSTHSATASGVESAATITNFFLRGNINEPNGITVDELRIGTTWADVVPEPASLSLFIAMAGLLGRRRR